MRDASEHIANQQAEIRILSEPREILLPKIFQGPGLPVVGDIVVLTQSEKRWVVLHRPQLTVDQASVVKLGFGRDGVIFPLGRVIMLDEYNVIVERVNSY